jgi:dTDP-4-dehydrorhamnose 3,5-epimerase
MDIIQTGFRDLFLIKPDVFSDNRGYFFESYNTNAFSRSGISYNFIQDNQSRSVYGVIRGLHYQLEPDSQAKLVRVLNGRIFDVVVDIRKGSPTFGKVFGTELNDENNLQLLIPKGFAHGFSVLSPEATVLYKTDNFYAPQSERGILFNDPQLGIDWKMEEKNILVSEKDLRNLPFSQADMNFIY